MANVLLGVTGSVAAIRVPTLYDELSKIGHSVKVVATQASLYFFDPTLLSPIDPTRPARNPSVVVLDEDEWPGRERGQRWQRSDPVLHIELRRWAELFLIAPLDANTLAKLANGLSDNCLTCVWRAWDPARPVVLAPAMNTMMWEHPLTERHLCQLIETTGTKAPANMDVKSLLKWSNANCPRMRVVPPISKRLACGDVGVGAIAEMNEIITMVNESIRMASPERERGE